jgi:hypothetical protein
MKRQFACAMFLAVGSCAPPYVWGDAERVKEQLLHVVPLGSSPTLLAEAATKRGWKVDQRNIQSWPAGSATYMNDHNLDCRSRGGPVVPAIIAHYFAPFDTYVESLWLFDAKRRLRDVCVRKTVDAL